MYRGPGSSFDTEGGDATEVDDVDDLLGAAARSAVRIAAVFPLPRTSPSEFLEPSENMTYPFHLTGSAAAISHCCRCKVANYQDMYVRGVFSALQIQANFFHFFSIAQFPRRIRYVSMGIQNE